MSSDGAHLGVGAERALDTILGGKDQPEESERKTPEQMAEHLRGATISDCNNYDGAARYCGKLVLEFMEANPTFEGDLYDGLNKRVTEEDREKCLSELSGFMWGWAENAARYALSKPPVPNPAIMTIGGQDA